MALTLFVAGAILGAVLMRLDALASERRGATSAPSQPDARALYVDTSRLALSLRRESERRSILPP